MATSKGLDPRERIWKAALKHFAASGYAGTGVQQIVDEAGVTKPTMYYHFGSKAELYEKLIENAFAERQKVMEAAAGQHTEIAGKLIAIGESQVEFARQHKELLRLCYATTFASPGELPPGLSTLTYGERNFRVVLNAIEQAMAQGELTDRMAANELAMAIYSQYFIVCITVVLLPDSYHSGLIERMVRLFLEGSATCCQGSAVEAASEAHAAA